MTIPRILILLIVCSSIPMTAWAGGWTTIVSPAVRQMYAVYPATIIEYQISDTNLDFGNWNVSVVSLKVFDVQGREVARLLEGVEQAGEHTVVSNAADQPTGMYFYRLQTASVSDPSITSVQVRKMIYMK